MLKSRTLRASRVLSARRVPAAAAIRKAEVSLLLTNDREIRELNKQWRRKDKATDVLSFPSMTKTELIHWGRRYRQGNDEKARFAESWPLGDIVISMDTARRQAAERGISLLAEVDRLFVHGLVHLLGYDHELSAAEARRMQRVERYLLTRI